MIIVHNNCYTYCFFFKYDYVCPSLSIYIKARRLYKMTTRNVESIKHIEPKNALNKTVIYE